MANMQRGAAAAPAVSTSGQSKHDEGVPALVGRLGDDLITLLDAKLKLLKVEIKEDATAYARSGAMIAAGAVIALVGFILVNVAIACFVSLLFGNDEAGAVLQRYGPTSYGLGFLVTGIVHLVIGGAIAYAGKNRMAGRNPAPEASIDELRKDKEWIKNET